MGVLCKSLNILSSNQRFYIHGPGVTVKYSQNVLVEARLLADVTAPWKVGKVASNWLVS